MNNWSVLISLFALLGLVSACDGSGSRNSSRGLDDGAAGFCSQANLMLDRDEAGELQPRVWAKMMIAVARLVYVSKDCGQRVSLPIGQLCGELERAIEEFSTDKIIPAGENRDTALQKSQTAYDRACAGKNF